jgi:hypothetical protein
VWRLSGYQWINLRVFTPKFKQLDKELTIYIEEMWQLAIQGHKQGIWFWAAIYTFIICTYSLVLQVRTRYWHVAQGELVESSVKKFGPTKVVKSDQNYVSNALYKFKVSDVTYEGTRISPWVFVASHNAKFVLKKQISAIERFPDGGVKVFYNPNKPNKSFLIIAGKTGICITLLISVLPIISFYIHYHL